MRGRLCIWIGTARPPQPRCSAAKRLPDLYSKGHRNPQGAALDAEGRLWVVEHGAQGGDELNLVQPGKQLWLARHYLWARTYGGRTALA
jgi:sugar lactone lactonase YvrE